MPEDKIGYQLSGYEKIEIIRAEIRELEEKLSETETKLRGILYEVERLRFLAGLAKPYAKSSAPEGYDQIDSLEARRVELRGLIAALKAAVPGVEAQATGSVPPAGAPAQPAAKEPGKSQKRKGFESFEDFRSKQ